MPYHVTLWPQSPRQQTLRELYAFNLTEEQLSKRFIAPHDEGRPITWVGRTLPAGDLSYLHVGFTESALDEQSAKIQFKEYELFKSASDVTNTWVTRGPGSVASPARAPRPSDPADRIVALCRRFDVVRRQLQRRHGKRPTLEIGDEYDVQDLIHALLLVDFVDVRAESWNPPVDRRSG